MKILLVSSYLPYPLNSGGHIRLYNLIKELSKKHEITLVCEKRSWQKEEDIKKVSEICKKVVTVNRKKQWSVGNILKSTLSLRSFLVTGHTSEVMQKIIKEELGKENFDLIHVETFYVYQNLPLSHLPKVLVEHNIEYEVYEKFANNTKKFARPLLKIDIQKIKRDEVSSWRSADILIAVSNDEKQRMNRDAEVVPNGVDIKKFSYMNSSDKFQKEKRILYIGDYTWIKNKDALSRIVNDIWPLIYEKNKDLTLWIVGKNIPSYVSKSPNTIISEDLKTPTNEIFNQSFALLAPIQVGGGTSYKILEAMASGVGVVSTKMGVEGIGVINNVHALLSDDPQTQAEMILDLSRDKEKYAKLTKNSRELIQESFSWEKIAERLERVYKKAVK